MALHRSWPAALQQLPGCCGKRSLHACSPKAQGLFSLLLGVVTFPVLRAVVQLATSDGFVEAATYDYRDIHGDPEEEAAEPVTWNLPRDPMVLDQEETPECEDITGVECAKKNAQRRITAQSPLEWLAATHDPGGAVEAPLPGTAAPSGQESLAADDVNDRDSVEDNARWYSEPETPDLRPLLFSGARQEHQPLDDDEHATADYGPYEEGRIPSFRNDARFPSNAAAESTGQSNLSQEEFSVSGRQRLDESRGELDSASQGEGAYWLPAGSSRSVGRRALGGEEGEEWNLPSSLSAVGDVEGDDENIAQAEDERRAKMASRGKAGGPAADTRGVKSPLYRAEEVGGAREVSRGGGAPQATSDLPRSKLSELKRRRRPKDQQGSFSRDRGLLRWIVPIASAAALLAGAAYGGRKLLGARRQRVT